MRTLDRNLCNRQRTGVISGSPLAAQSSTAYTINATGTETVDVSITLEISAGGGDGDGGGFLGG